MAPTMHNTKNNDFVFQYAVEHCVWKAAQDCAPDLPVHTRVCERALGDGHDRDVHFCTEKCSKSRSARFVPVACLEKLCLGLGPKDEPQNQAPSLSLRRTSTHGTAELGSARCSLRRRSSSAACSGLRLS